MVSHFSRISVRWRAEWKTEMQLGWRRRLGILDQGGLAAMARSSRPTSRRCEIPRARSGINGQRSCSQLAERALLVPLTDTLDGQRHRSDSWNSCCIESRKHIAGRAAACDRSADHRHATAQHLIAQFRGTPARQGGDLPGIRPVTAEALLHPATYLSKVATRSSVGAGLRLAGTPSHHNGRQNLLR